MAGFLCAGFCFLGKSHRWAVSKELLWLSMGGSHSHLELGLKRSFTEVPLLAFCLVVQVAIMWNPKIYGTP